VQLLAGSSTLWLGQLFLDVRWKRLHSFDIRGHRPHLFVRIPLAVGKHAASADAVFDDPEDLCFGIFGAHKRQLGNRWKQHVAAIILGFSWDAMAAGASIDIELPTCDEIFVSGRKRVLHFRRFAADRSMNG